jgi:hypothetical protein
VGFSSGVVLALDIDSLQVLSEMTYHKTAITAIHQHGDWVVTGCTDGVTVLWNATTLTRAMIGPFHRLPIVGILHDGKNWIVVDRTGIMTIHDQGLTQLLEKASLCRNITHVCQHRPNRIITVADELLMWEGKRIVKTFNAVPITPNIVCAIKPPELLVLGSPQSQELRFVFLESLLFPRTAHIPEGPPIAIGHNGSAFYALTASGDISVIEAAG